MCMCDVICKEVEKNRDNDVCMCDVIDRENGNDCMCAVAINTEANIENNLQLESFSSLFKLFRVTALVYKFVEKLKRKAKIKIKQVENKIEKMFLISIWALSIPKISMLHQICSYGISSMYFIRRSMMT